MRLFYCLWLFVLWMNTEKSFQQNEVRCRLTLPPLEGTMYEPAYRSVFSSGDTVRVTCGSGHWISNPQDTSAVITCNDDGEWSVGPECQDFLCSNPQDPLVHFWYVELGQFRKFGEYANYRCKSGYKRTNGITRAICTRDGWRPNPLCQEITCDRQDIQNAHIVTNNKLKYKYSERVNYVCRDGYQGSVTRTCGENGWIGDSQCTDTKCRVPLIENGIVIGNIREYDTDILHFECNVKYKRTENRPSVCTEIGIRAEWSPTPMCEPVKCRLTLPPLEGTSYEPAYRNVFTPDEQVTVTCGEKYWISNPRDTSAVTTCTATGDWTVRPVCKEVTCRNQRERNVNSWDVYWGQRITLGDTARYRCRSGYKSTDGTNLATCTRDGWRPNPLCQEIICETEDIPNANIVNPKWRYRNNEQANYECKEGYEGRPTRICGENGWTGDSQCTGEK
ncbi:complement factor H-like isoform X2 [Pagrus major]|uniref:complement factor H-like isoform X2 n=1 Tax=Pagrus major TaxID=143350 RepID=UPI003CC8AF57